MKNNPIPGPPAPGQRVALSLPFVLMAILFNVCLIASNLFETKIFTAGMLTLTGGVIIFPVSYILNDCIVEVWGYKKARLVIWTGFAMNFFVVAMAQPQLVTLPRPPARPQRLDVGKAHLHAVRAPALAVLRRGLRD